MAYAHKYKDYKGKKKLQGRGQFTISRSLIAYEVRRYNRLVGLVLEIGGYWSAWLVDGGGDMLRSLGQDFDSSAAARKAVALGHDWRLPEYMRGRRDSEATADETETTEEAEPCQPQSKKQPSAK